MANTFLTPTIIAKEALIALENNLVLANLVHRDYSREFQNVGATILVRKPATFTSGTVSSTVNMSTATESSVAVALDTQLDVTLNITDRELTLNIVDFSEQVIQPIMRAHAQAVDTQIAKLYADVAAHAAVSSTTGAARDLTDLAKVMDINKVPTAGRNLVFHPTSKARYMALDAFLHAEKRGDGGQALREAEMGRTLGFDCYMDQNMQTHVYSSGGTLTDTAGAASAATVGATSIVIYNLGTAELLTAGEVFKPTGDDNWYVLTAASTLSSGIATISIAPAIRTALTDAQVVTFQDDHKVSLAFHKNAFALVTAPLAPPLGGAKGDVVTYKGLSCRVVYDYTTMTKTNLMSIDMLLGTKTLDRDLAARLCDAQA